MLPECNTVPYWDIQYIRYKHGVNLYSCKNIKTFPVVNFCRSTSDTFVSISQHCCAVIPAAPVCCFTTKLSIPAMSVFKLTGGFDAVKQLSWIASTQHSPLSTHSLCWLKPAWSTPNAKHILKQALPCPVNYLRKIYKQAFPQLSKVSLEEKERYGN